MDEATYRADPRPSITQLAKLDRMTPAHARVEWAKPPSKNMQFGTAFHAMVLEPDRFDELVTVAPAPINPRTGEPYGVGTKAHDEWVAANTTPGKTLITTVQHEAMFQMAKSVWALDIDAVRSLGEEYLLIEQPLFGSIVGVECKGRPDLVCTARLEPFAPLIIDLKTTGGKATAEEFQRAMVDYGYAFQAAGYMMLAEQDHEELLEGAPFHRFIFVVVESEPPYAASAFRLKPKVVDWYRPRVERAALLWSRCTQSDDFRAYSLETQDIGMPRWHEASRATTGDNA